MMTIRNNRTKQRLPADLDLRRFWGIPLVLGVAGLSWFLIQPAVAQHYSDWSEPENVGPAVNTAWDEQHPALSPDGLSLYFVSNRPDGVGGSDIPSMSKLSIAPRQSLLRHLILAGTYCSLAANEPGVAGTVIYGCHSAKTRGTIPAGNHR
jgi:hypothetical protein